MLMLSHMGLSMVDFKYFLIPEITNDNLIIELLGSPIGEHPEDGDSGKATAAHVPVSASPAMVPPPPDV